MPHKWSAHHHAQAARAADAEHLDEQTLTDLRRRYLGAYTAGIRDNQNRAGPLARDAAALARRFCDHQDMILRFVVDLAVPFTNNQAERDLRPVKIQQRTSGGTWRTLTALADFAVVQSYLSTARKWGESTASTFSPSCSPAVHHRRLATTRRRPLRTACLVQVKAGHSANALVNRHVTDLFPII